MSRFFSKKYAGLTPYTPGEQPRDMQYVKLNTNESPFPPSPKAQAYAAAAAARLELYPDPTCRELTEKLASVLGVTPDRVLLTNGSDEALYFAFLAFCDKDTSAVFPDITYGFYPVYAEMTGIPSREIPLREDFTVDAADCCDAGGTVFLANPNAPTGIALPLSEVESIVRSNQKNVVVVDEAYVDFGGETCVPLTEKYDNMLVIQTFSKSRSMAGARLGFAVGDRALIRDLNTIKFSTNPYNINRMTMAAGLGALEDDAYFRQNCAEIVKTRADTAEKLAALGFRLTPSRANFLFASHPAISGGELYEKLKARGVLVRYFDKPRLRGHVRITVGSRAQMNVLLREIEQILEEVR